VGAVLGVEGSGFQLLPFQLGSNGGLLLLDAADHAIAGDGQRISLEVTEVGPIRWTGNGVS
jgi:hypothetical protein